MNPTLKNILGAVAGLVAGMAINMGIVMVGMAVITFPEGMDPMETESIKAHMDQFTAIHFLFPFLAHAAMSFFGSWIASLIAVKKMPVAMILGVLFLIAGIINVTSIVPPVWFIVFDLAIAYIPMAWLGAKMGIK